MDNIEKIIYINLDKRTDRRIHFENEMKRLCIPESKVIRFPGICNIPPLAGCCKSHSLAIKMAADLDLNNVLIMEDDFTFIDDIKKINDSLDYFFKKVVNNGVEWNGLLLTRINRVAKPYSAEDHPPILQLCHESTNGAGYLLNKNILNDLSQTMADAVQPLAETGAHWLYQNDMVWFKYMRDDKWFGFTDYLGYQMAGFSDNGNCPVGEHR